VLNPPVPSEIEVFAELVKQFGKSRVVCDSTNNSPEDIAARRLRMDLYVPVPVHRILINLSVHKNDTQNVGFS